MLRKYYATTARTLTSTLRPFPTSWSHSAVVRRKSFRASMAATTATKPTAWLPRFHTTQTQFLSTMKESFSEDDSFPLHMNDTMAESLQTLNIIQNQEDRDNVITDATFLHVDSEMIVNEQQQHHNIPTEPTDIISRRQDLKERLAKEVQSNVQTIIRQIDSLKESKFQQKQQEQHDEAQPQTTETLNHQRRSSTQKSSIENSLSRKWEIALRREMQGFHRGRDEPGRSSRSSSHHATIDAIWDKAIQTADIGHLVRIANDFSSVSKRTIVSDEENQIAVSNAILSPIFGVRVLDSGVIEHHDIPKTSQVEAGIETRSINQATLFQDDSHTVASPESSSKESLSAIHSCLALLAVTSKSEWNLFENNRKALVNLDSPPGDNVTHGDMMGHDLAQEMLKYSQVNRLSLTTEECNLLIAQILSSPTMDVDEILERSVVFFNEMKRVSATGIENAGPDTVTYRLLFSALLRRLIATGEAAQICKIMANSSFTLNRQILLDAMKVCQAYGDLGTASKLMGNALENKNEPSFTVQSALVFIEMMQKKELIQEALVFIDNIRKSKVLSPQNEDEVLLQLCRWPNRSRNGNTIDCSSVLVHVKEAIFDKVKHGERPRLHLWFVLLEQLAQAELLDPSLGNHINQTFRGMLEAYPDAWPGMGLLKIGLRAAEATRDAGLIASLLERNITRTVAKRHKTGGSGQIISEDAPVQQAPVPLMVFRKALQFAYRTLNTDAASTILEHYRQVDGDYPASAKAEVYGLVIQTYAHASEGEKAKSLLFSMIDDGVEPTEELAGIVIQSLVSSGKTDDARELFDAMMKGIAQLPAPNVTSYNAILVAAINARDWDDAISIVDDMQGKGVRPNSQTTQARLLAHVNKFGPGSVPMFMRQLLTERAPVDQETFTLAFRIILPALDGKDIDDIRMKARAMGEKEPRLREASLKMVRSVRAAETLSSKTRRNPQGTIPQSDTNERWMVAFSDLLEFSQKIDVDVVTYYDDSK